MKWNVSKESHTIKISHDFAHSLFLAMIKVLFRHFLAATWLMKIVLIWAWVSALIMVCALFSPYYQALLAAYYH